jgi:hypothetical protein
MEFHISTEIQNDLAQNQPPTAAANKKVHLDLVRDLTQVLGIQLQPGMSQGADVESLCFGEDQPECTGCGACKSTANS